MFDDLFGEEAAKRDGKEIFAALERAARERILVLDGAMGTQIQSLKLDEDQFRGDRFIGCACHQKGNNDLLILTRPDIVSTITEGYLKAGADIVSTNTFSATTIAMADYGMESLVGVLNREGARMLVECPAPHVQPIYRVHPSPPEERLASLRTTLASVERLHALGPAFHFDPSERPLATFLAENDPRARD